MKISCSLVVLLLSMVDLAAEVRTERLPEEAVTKLVSLNPEYLVYEKEGAGQKRLPLIIYLHGAGGVGENVRKIEKQPGFLLATVEKAGVACLCVAPQASKSPRHLGKKGGWVPADLDLLIAHLKKTMSIDPTRIYLTGNSMGGYGTIAWAAHSPGHFAALAPMVGGLGPGGPKDVTEELDVWGKNLKQIPLSAYYGRQDRVVPPDRGAMLLKAIKQAGGTLAEVIVLEDEGHGAGRVPYGDEDFVKWLFSNKKGDRADSDSK